MSDADDIGEIANPVGAIEGPDDETPAAEQASATVGRRARKPLNKALFAAAAAAAKAHVTGIEEDEPADDLVVTGPGAAAASSGDAKPDDKPADQPKPIAGPPAEAIAAWERVNLRAAELEKRETALMEREKRHGDMAAQFAAKPLATMRELVRLDLGDEATEDEVNEELSYQLTALSLEHAGATIDPSNQAHDLRKLKREVRRTKAEGRKKQSEDVRKTTESSKAEQERRAVATIGEEFKAISSKYPFLAADDDAPGLIFDVAKEWHRRTGDVPDLDALAQRAEDTIREEATAKIKRYQHLLQPTPTPTPAVASAHQGDPPNRRSRTLTNKDASEDVAPSPDAPGQRLSTEERRARTFAKWSPKLKEAERD